MILFVSWVTVISGKHRRKKLHKHTNFLLTTLKKKPYDFFPGQGISK